MGLVSKTSLVILSRHKYIRFDSKYLRVFNKINFQNFILLKDMFEIINGNSYTKNYVNYKTNKAFIRIGDLTFNGQINNENIVYLDENTEIPNNKILKEDDLILATIGATIGKINLARDFKNGTFSNNTVVLRLKKENNPFFLEKLFQTNIMRYYISGISSQKAQPNLQLYDIEQIKIPNISLNTQNNIMKQIEPLEEQIKILKSQKKEHLEIINEVFSNSFDINLDEVKKLENIKQFTLPLRVAHTKNSSLRNSFKWHKLETIQSYMYGNIDCIKKLGNCIVQTKNGWSPLSSEVEEGTAILGQEHITKEGKISLEASKFTTVTKSNIEDFYIKKNDFFVSRGNTVELVALASVVLNEVEENILYPDLYIKIDFDDELVYKEYMAFIFNSFFGRIYFGHVAKGKNQTMVKVSAKELYEFYLPLPDISVQQEIVDNIRVSIDSQQNIDNQIEEKQKEISELIESVIRDEK